MKYTSIKLKLKRSKNYLRWTYLLGLALFFVLWWCRASLIAQSVKYLPAIQETWVRFLGREDSLEKETATQSSISLANSKISNSLDRAVLWKTFLNSYIVQVFLPEPGSHIFSLSSITAIHTGISVMTVCNTRISAKSWCLEKYFQGVTWRMGVCRLED